ncbi:MAG TPA: hypothetical protein VEV63_20080 [Streptosporangiaceae bacterium]|nr:hypothetical protein [Streptosporangiaceae bacterium]
MIAVEAPSRASDLTPQAVVQRRDWLHCLHWLPLAVIVAAQVVLSARLIPASYASGDEGRYIYAGHQLIYELWHGGGSPFYETYFSGAPVIYPVLAAMADYVGGLTAACLMSTAFMVVATIMLFLVTRELFGYWSAVLASGLFAGLGLTQDLGALATYDAMSLMLITIAAHSAVRAGTSLSGRQSSPLDEPTGGRTRWLLTIPVLLFLANATKYMTIIFDPFVIALAALQVTGWKAVAKRTIALGLATLTLDTLFLFLAGVAYVRGLLFSTLARKAGSSAVFAAVKVGNPVIIGDTWKWIGPILAAALFALLTAVLARRDVKTIVIIGILVFAGLIVTAEGFHLHTVESMRKHDDFSAWFACAASGSIAARLRLRGLLSRVAAVLIGCAVLVSGLYYSYTAKSTYEAGGSPTTLQIASTLRPYLNLPNGRFLVGGLATDQLVYLGKAKIPWFQLSDDLYIKYPIPGRGGDTHGQVLGRACLRLRPGCMYLEGIAGYRAAIRSHYFDLITMWGGHHIRQDALIEQAVENTPGYVLIAIVAGAPTWIYAPAYRPLTAAPRPEI